MPANFLHGVETIELDRGPRPIRTVKSAVIGLVGTAPIWALAAADRTLNEPVLVLSAKDAAQYFGPALPGYTIPQALDAIFDQGNGLVVVVNVFDPATHKTAVPEAEFVVAADGTVQLPHIGLMNVVVKSQDGATTHVAGTDYTVDPVTGRITRVAGGAIAAAATVKVAYDRADLTKVTPAEVIGAVSAGGQRSGLKALQDAASLFGFAPKLLIAPAYCTQNSVATEMIAIAEALRAFALIDAPIGTTVADAIAGRGAAGAINFNTSSKRAILCYPHLKVYDPATDTEVLEPFSQRLAGVIAARDIEQGYWWSPSNAEILGVTGVERPLTAAINDAASEVNLLNEVGILTVFNGFGTGLRTWGNRSAAWPTVTHPRNFVNIQRTADLVHESVEQAMLQFADQPITDAVVDAVMASVNAFFRTLIGRGALIDGACTFDPAKNPPEELGAGHLTFDLTFMPPTPAERITFESFIDLELLRSIGAGSGS